MNSTPLISFNKIISFPRPGRLKDELKSRTRSLDIDHEIIDYFLTQYDLKLIGKSINLPNARRNTNLIIETTSGKKVLKNYRSDWNISTINFEHSILQKLKSLDFASPRLVPLKDGNTWITVNGLNYCMFDFIQGRNYSSSFLLRSHRIRMMATAGRTLASLHRQLIGFQPDGLHHLGFKSLDQERFRNLSWNAQKIEELVQLSIKIKKPEDKQHAEWLIRNSNEVFHNLVALDQTLEGAGLPRLIIHGDYGLHNLIYTNADHAVPVDFELARIEWRMSDLVSVISKFRYKDGSYDFESIVRFLHAYQIEFPISANEWEVFPFVWKFYKLMKSIQYWISYFETNGPVRKLRSARDEIEYADWAMANPNRVSEFREIRQ